MSNNEKSESDQLAQKSGTFHDFTVPQDADLVAEPTPNADAEHEDDEGAQP